MTLTIGQIFSAAPALQKLVAASLPALMALKVARLIHRLNPELEPASATRLSVFRQFGIEKDGQIQVPTERLPDFQAALEPLFSECVEIDCQPLPIALFEHAPDMTVEEMMVLLPFIQESDSSA